MSKGLFTRIEGELEAREQLLGLRMSDLLVLPESQCKLLNWMIRQGQVSLADVIAFLRQDESAVYKLLGDVVEKGYVREIDLHGGTFYRVRLAPKRGRELPANLWQALDAKCGDGGKEEGGR